MALEGTIKDFGLPDIFQLIGLQRKTGILTLKRDAETVTVTFENGMVVMADTSGKRLEDRLGNVLVKQGKVTPERLDEALQTQRATLQRLGHVLLSGGYIGPKDLKDALQVQVSGIVFRLFRWRDGHYHFEPADSVEYDREHFNPMSADFILMEGIRMVDEWPIIEKKIPSMDIVFRSVVDPSMIEVGGGGDEGGLDDAFSGFGETSRKESAASGKIRLGGEEERIYRKVNGTHTVQQIIDATGIGEFEVCRTLFDLLNRNIIATVGRGTGRGAEAVAGRQQAASPALGYAVMGVAVVLSVVGLLAQLTTPFGVLGLGAFLRPAYHAVLEGVAQGRLERIARAARAFRLARGQTPKALDEIVEAGLLDARDVTDPFGRPYRYEARGDGFTVTLAGAPAPPAPAPPSTSAPASPSPSP